MQRRRYPIGSPPPPGFRHFGTPGGNPLFRLSGLAGESHRSSDGVGINPNGDVGPLIADYNERTAWGTGGPGGAGVSSPPPVGAFPSLTGLVGVSTTPFGVILGPDGKPFKWTNPTTFASVPILASTAVNPPTPSATPVLSLNYARNALTVQNNSTATVAGDVAPTMYVGFNAAPQIGISFALAPGVGHSWDIQTPRDSIFIIFGAFANAGASVVIQGVVVQGTYSP